MRQRFNTSLNERGGNGVPHKTFRHQPIKARASTPLLIHREECKQSREPLDAAEARLDDTPLALLQPGRL